MNSTMTALDPSAARSTVISADRVRKEMAGLNPDLPAAAAFGEGIYTPGWTHRTYAAILHRAEILLERGEYVVLDASWSSERHRATARELAQRTHTTVTEICCVAPADVAAERLASRRRGASDADASIAAKMAAAMDPWPQANTVDAARVLTTIAEHDPQWT
jgi:uncharacterized protein